MREVEKIWCCQYMLLYVRHAQYRFSTPPQLSVARLKGCKFGEIILGSLTNNAAENSEDSRTKSAVEAYCVSKTCAQTFCTRLKNVFRNSYGAFDSIWFTTIYHFPLSPRSTQLVLNARTGFSAERNSCCLTIISH